MSTPQHILAATDLSDASLQAVDRAFVIAQHTQARCTVMHALGLDALGPLRNLIGADAEQVTHKAVAHQEQALQAVVDAPQRNQGVRAAIRVEAGMANNTVPAFAVASGVDLIVVGARGQGMLKRLLVGSTASRLLRKSQCPVLVVKQPGHQPYRRVLIPMDFSPASEMTVRMARAVAPGADLVLLHVFDVPFEGMLRYAGVSQPVIHQYRTEARTRANQALHELADRVGLTRTQYTGLVEYGDPVRHIVDAQRHHGCDLIAMGKHGTHVTEELLLGSVTKHVLSDADTDVLVVVDPRPQQIAPAPLPGE